MRGLLGAGLLVAALAGCGSVVASDPPATSAAAAAPAAPAAPAGSATASPAVGCASVNQATTITIRRMAHLMMPVGKYDPVSATYRNAAQVRALFGQMCAAVTHPAPVQVMHCPADLGTEYLGAFYDGPRELATFTFATTGCERVSVTAAGKTQVTFVYGRAAAAAPHLNADLDAIITRALHELRPQVMDTPAGQNAAA